MQKWAQVTLVNTNPQSHEGSGASRKPKEKDTDFVNKEGEKETPGQKWALLQWHLNNLRTFQSKLPPNPSDFC